MPKDMCSQVDGAEGLGLRRLLLEMGVRTQPVRIELYSDSDSFDAEQQRSSSFDGEQQAPTSKGTISGRKSMRLSVKLPGGPSPRLSRQTSELEESLTPH